MRLATTSRRSRWSTCARAAAGDARGRGRGAVGGGRPRPGHRLEGRSRRPAVTRSSGRGRGSRRSPPPRSSDRGARADALRDLGQRRRLLVRPHEEPLSGGLTPRYVELEEQLLAVYDERGRALPRRRRLPELDRLVRAGIAARGIPVSRRTRSRTAWARGPRTAVRAPGRLRTIRAGMVPRSSRDLLGGGGGLRVEDNWLVTDGDPEKLCAFPDGIVRA